VYVIGLSVNVYFIARSFSKCVFYYKANKIHSRERTIKYTFTERPIKYTFTERPIKYTFTERPIIYTVEKEQ
jgi:hypothetical protein